jgi:hypothetical protein
MRNRVSSLSVSSGLEDKEESKQMQMDHAITVVIKMYCVEVTPLTFIASSQDGNKWLVSSHFTHGETCCQ